jgi:hypothetical protein
VNLKRRAFLQHTALALGALGVSGTTLFGWANQYQRALAKPTRRKLALLIGINQYPERAIDPMLAQDIALKGCLTDLDLQRELLLYRFGFSPSDIVTLQNQEATRQGILDAIDHHLVQQAQAGDVVLIHFSGYGGQVRLENDSSGTALAWIPVDGWLPTEQNPTIDDLLEAELAVKLLQLKTNNLTTIVDAGAQDLGNLRWGVLKLRSRPTVPTGILPQNSLITPQSWRSTDWPGLMLRAGEPGHLVLEGQWHGFSAGVFTYALTQTLWETSQPPTPQILLRRAKESLQQWTGPDQQPVLLGTVSTEGSSTGYRLPTNAPPADGVVLSSSSENRPITLWLGGMPAAVLEYLQPGSQFLTAPSSSNSAMTIQAVEDPLVLRVESRNRLRVNVKPMNPERQLPAVGQPVYEKLRLLPRNIDLVVALDGQLERVERVDATSALASIPFVISTTAGEQPADCLFGRLPSGLVSTLTASLPDVAGLVAASRSSQEKSMEGSYGLFAPNRTLIPGTLLAREEAVKTAVGRLTPHLQTLLAMKLVRLTQNRISSWLPAAAVLEITQPKAQALIWQRTERNGSKLAENKAIPKATPLADTIQLTADNRIVYRLSNSSNQPLHFALMSFNSRGECLALIAPTLDHSVSGNQGSALGQMAVLPGRTQVLPDDGADWGIPSDVVWIETHIVLSSVPLMRCLEVLRQQGETNFRQSELKRVKQPLQLARALLQDLNSATAETIPDLTSADYYALHQENWVTFSFRYSVI